ncbi:MAG TPA: gliding motility-associated ABC transporter ATP-binding subunit GldA [Chitinophagales bacterium]|nr:gliding motility-associated ABC transporter ATP-binding subunit GldA [Chitinophagales bacterium]
MSVTVKDLTKIYGEQKAVNSISFEVKKGEVLGFLGPNGAGKSTTMKIITGFLPQSSGTVTVNGISVSEENVELKKHIGYLPESNPLYPEMYVKEYLEFCASLYQIPNPQKRIAEMIGITGLSVEQKKKIGQLSKGYKQRVGLAQAMLHNPEVLILDEPTSGLDPNQLIEIRSLIKQLGKDKTVIFSSHIMQEVQAVADRVIIINRGKIVADDTAAELQSRLNNEMVISVEFKQSVHRELLLKIKGVKLAQQQGNTWQLTATGKEDIRESVFEFAKQNQLTMLGLQREKYSLEEVFKQLTGK